MATTVVAHLLHQRAASNGSNNGKGPSELKKSESFKGSQIGNGSTGAKNTQRTDIKSISKKFIQEEPAVIEEPVFMFPVFEVYIEHWYVIS